MALWKDINNRIYDDNDGAAQSLPAWPTGLTKLTSEEALALLAGPTPTLEALSEGVRLALQAAIDDKAKALGFSGGNALMLYASFTNPFKAIALPFAQWESTVWAEAEAYKQEVIAGRQPMKTGAEAVLMMPELVLP